MEKIRPYQRKPVSYAYLGNHQAITTTYFGSTIFIDTRNVQHAQLITHGRFEKGVSWAIEQNLTKEQVMIDVGANIGFFTLLGCQTVGPKGKVYAFEPNPCIFQMLSQSILANAFRKRTSCHNLAAFNQQGEMELTWQTEEHGGGRLITPDIKRINDNQATVKTARLDDIIDPKDNISLIKIDTEGAEPYVLEGLQQTLENNDCTVITEWVPGFIKDRSYDINKAIELIDQHFNSIEKINGIDKVEKISIDRLLKNERFDLILRQ